MQVRWLEAAMFVMITLLCSGCYGAKETDDVAYVLVMGVDQAEEGKLRITYQTAVPRKTSKDSSAGGAEMGDEPTESTIITTITAPPVESRMLLNTAMSRVPKLTHIIAFICSEEVARKGLGPSIANIIGNHDFRERIYLIVVPGSAEEYIKQNKPVLDANIADFYEIAFASASESGYYLPATVHEFYNRLKNAGGSPYTAYSDINPMTGEDKPSGSKTPEQKGDPYLPGGIPRSGTANPVDFAGLAVFRGHKLVGVLNSDEARAVTILQGKLSSGYIGVVDPLQPKKDAVMLKIRTESKPKITVRLNGAAPIFEVVVKIEAELLGTTSGINYEAPDYRVLLETQIANLIKGQILFMIKHTQELGTDPVGFGLYLRPLFGSTSEMEQAKMTALYQASDIAVNVTAKIRRTGLNWRTSEKKESK